MIHKTKYGWYIVIGKLNFDYIYIGKKTGYQLSWGKGNDRHILWTKSNLEWMEIKKERNYSLKL